MACRRRRMSIHEYLMKACQDDALRAGERDRQLLEARRARKAGRNHQEPAAPAAAVVQVRRLTRLMWRLRFRGNAFSYPVEDPPVLAGSRWAQLPPGWLLVALPRPSAQ